MAKRQLFLKSMAALGAAQLLLAGCSLQPLYTGGGDGTIARGLAAVEVPAIPGRAGWLMRNALTERLSVAGSEAPKYRLDVRLDDDLQGLGVLADDTISRERRTLRARYQLIELSSGSVLLDATAGSDAGIDVVSSEYATIAGEQKALENLSLELADQMVKRIALTLRNAS